MGVLLALLMAELAVPSTTTLVRFGSGLVLLQEQAEGGDTVRVLNREGTTLRVLNPGETLRRSRMHDMAVVDGRTVAVSVSTPGTLGPAVQEILVYGEQGEPQVVSTQRTVCYVIAPDGAGGYWCLGPELGAGPGTKYDALTRWTGHGNRAASYLPRGWFPAMEGDPEPYQLGATGAPQLLNARRGVLLAWLPAAREMVRVDAATGSVERRMVAVRGAGRRTVSFAIAPGGARYALLPDSGEEETFRTQYVLHAAGADDAAWKPVVGARRMPRSSYLLGVDGRSVVVWVRPERKVCWIAVE